MRLLLVVQFNFELLINDAEGGVHIIASFLHLFCEVLGVLGLVRKL